MTRCPSHHGRRGRARAVALVLTVAVASIPSRALADAPDPAGASDAHPPDPAGTAGAAADASALVFDERELARRLALAEHFDRSEQYYRAIGVLEELRLFAPTDELRAWARLRIAISYHRGAQHDAALGAYDRALAEPALPGDVRRLAIVQRAAARADQELADPGHTALSDLIAELGPAAAAGDAVAQHAAFLRARIAAVADDRAALRESLAAARAGCVAVTRTRADACERVETLERHLQGPPPRRRSAVLSVTLSAVVPGLGSAYAGHPVDGLYYGGLTTLTALGALDVYDGSRDLSDQRVAFWGLATAAGLFYLSGLLHARVAAARFNAVERHRWLRRVWDDTAPPLPLAELPPPRSRSQPTNL